MEREILKHGFGVAAVCLLSFLCSITAQATYPTGYYDSLEGKCGAELKKAVKQVAYNHTVISYGDDTWDVFRITDVKTVNGVDYWWDMYSNNLVRISSGNGGLNIEHSVANSWWGKSKNDAYKDIVHLNPSDAYANNKKANYPLAELKSVDWDNGVTFVGTPKDGQGGGSGKGYEPADEYKGDFARVFMYMFTVYDNISWKDNTDWMYDTSSSLTFRPWAQELLLRWSADDPVSNKERVRNDGIHSKQHNRNPFIDLPDLAEHIWGSKRNVPFSLYGNEYPEDPDDPTDPEGDRVIYEWLASTSTSLSPGWTYEDVELPSGGTYIWDWKSHNSNYYLNGSAYIQQKPYAAEGYAWSPEVDLANSTSVSMTFDHAAKFQTTLKDLCKVAVRDMTTDEVQLFDIPTWPSAGTWNFVNAGNIDLSSLNGKKVRIGFRYKSTSTGADTWEINNVKVTVNKTTSSIESVPGIDEDDDDSFLVEVWGNNIYAPEGAVIFDLNGRTVSGENVNAGVYIVVKPTFKRAVKVLVK